MQTNDYLFFTMPLHVTSAGFEPATNRAEICHSIQLNYEANLTIQKY